MNYKPHQALELFDNVKPKFTAYRDANTGDCKYECTLEDCICGL